MPLKKCSKNGKSGWKWGDQGHCYTGKDGKKRAIKQGLAIEGLDNFKKEMNKSSGEEQSLMNEVLEDSSETQLIIDLAKEVTEYIKRSRPAK